MHFTGSLLVWRPPSPAPSTAGQACQQHSLSPWATPLLITQMGSVCSSSACKQACVIMGVQLSNQHEQPHGRQQLPPPTAPAPDARQQRSSSPAAAQQQRSSSASSNAATPHLGSHAAGAPHQQLRSNSTQPQPSGSSHQQHVLKQAQAVGGPVAPHTCRAGRRAMHRIECKVERRSGPVATCLRHSPATDATAAWVAAATTNLVISSPSAHNVKPEHLKSQSPQPPLQQQRLTQPHPYQVSA